MTEPRNYTRWTGGARADDPMVADLLGGPRIEADPSTGKVSLTDVSTAPMSPDLARMIGVRLIEAAALADGNRAIRRTADR
jgi:hypothetical protein